MGRDGVPTDEREDDAGEGRSTWTGRGRVRARSTAQGLEVAIDGLTTQAKYYKPLVYEFFRKEWRGARASYGDFCVEITMFYTGDPPWLDLDNLAKALLDSIIGYAFHDDSQVARLVVERRQGDRERIVMRASLLRGEPG